MSRRVLALLGAVAMTALLVVVLSSGDHRYLVRAELQNAIGLREGFKVRVDGVPVGTVTKVRLGRGDVAIAEARIEPGAAPLGAGARATVRAANLLGEKYLDIDRGDVSRPAPSGVVIPVARTGVAVQLDDVIDALDLPTRAALNVVLDEAGRGLTGRAQSLSSLLAVLPHSLDKSGALLAALGHDNRALGALVDESDRVVGSLAGERRQLGRLVSGAATTFDTLADRRGALGDTVRNAPSTLTALRDALAALEGAAVPLAPAARGLQATAPQLTATLRQLPPAARAARPALRTARQVAPSLDRLGFVGTPIARRLRPLASELRTFSTGVQPATAALDEGIADTLAVLEGWARSTAGHDAAGHVFRVAATAGSDLLQALVAAGTATQTNTAAARTAPADARGPQNSTPALRVPQPRLPAVRLPDLKLPDAHVKAGGQSVARLLDFLLGP